jgi:hypothetical protein
MYYEDLWKGNWKNEKYEEDHKFKLLKECKHLSVKIVKFPRMLQILNERNDKNGYKLQFAGKSNPDYDSYSRLATINSILKHKTMKHPICIEQLECVGASDSDISYRYYISSGHTTSVALYNFLPDYPYNAKDEIFLDLGDGKLFIRDREEIDSYCFPIFLILDKKEVSNRIKDLQKMKINPKCITNLKTAVKRFQTYPFVYYEKKN